MAYERSAVEDSYRKYFYDIRGFRPFPMTVTLENLVDFVLWRDRELMVEVEDLVEVRELREIFSSTKQ